MKKITIIPALLILAVVFMASCGGETKTEEVVISEKAAMLIDKTWTPDLNATIEESTNALDSATNIVADIELKGDVKGIADFIAGTLRFGKDQSDKTKLSYERKYGQGILSTSVLGYWNLNEDESAIIMREWDSYAGAEKEPVTYKIVELTEKKLALLKDGELTPDIYVTE